jgi:ferredoxin-nitrite reductase
MFTELKTLPFERIGDHPMTPEQKSYLLGLFSGLEIRGLKFCDVAANPLELAKQAAPPENLIFEERVKRELHPLDAYPLLLEHASVNRAPDRENTYRFKWNGLFYMTPNKEAFMARLRIPAGQLKTFQLRELARIANDLTTGYIQITTRANFQMRHIEPKDAPEFLQRIQGIGLHTRGSGADNIRNLTANPTAGIDPYELIDTAPLCQQLGQIIINNREFYDLPRKFNIAFDGGGLIGTVEDTNDIGIKAVLFENRIYFRIALGGATGHKAFARDLGVLVPPEEILKVTVGLLRVYIANGCRTDRKKARLKHLLETWTLDQYLAETEKLLGGRLQRAPLQGVTSPKLPETAHSHVGVFPQKQKGLNYIGVAIPVGNLTSKHLLRLAELADNYGSGEVRLTVWQNLILPNIPDAFVDTVKKALVKMGLHWQQSNLRSGLIACTGNAYCKFASSDTKRHALALADYLERRIRLDQPINIHLTGCPNSCAQHYMGDIGLLATKVKVSGETLEGYHVFVGGGFGDKQAVGRQVFSAISIEQLKPTLEKMLKAYQRHRQDGESFAAFSRRHDLNSLQVLFCELD